MVAELDKAPINQSHDFQLGVLFARMDSTDAMMAQHIKVTDAQFTNLRTELATTRESFKSAISDLGVGIRKDLTEQTEQLKPLLDQETIRKAIADRDEQKQESWTNFCVRWGAIIGIFCGLFGLMQIGIKVYVHVPVQVVPVQGSP